MLVHTVLFWLKPDLEPEARERFREGLESLRGISAAEAVHIGTPAQTAARPVIDASYDFCLTVLLNDVAAHDAYQANPRHRSFIDAFSGHWEKVVIYDAD